MTFYSGITNYSNVTSSYSFLDLVDSKMVENGWTLVETYPSAKATDYGKVWKSAGADNGIGDFYIGGYVPSANIGTLYFVLAESYNPVNHKFDRYVPASGVQTMNADYTLSNSAGALLSQSDDNTPFIYTNGATGMMLTHQGWPHAYFFSINKYRIHLCTRIGITDYGIYIGATENLIPNYAAASVSLAMVNSYTSGSRTQNRAPYYYACGFTREPGGTGTEGNFAASLDASYFWPNFPGVGTADWIYTGSQGRVVCRPVLYSNRDNAATWVPRALLWPGHYVLPSCTGRMNGDTFTLGGRTYVCMVINGYATWVDNSL